MNEVTEAKTGNLYQMQYGRLLAVVSMWSDEIRLSADGNLVACFSETDMEQFIGGMLALLKTLKTRKAVTP